MNNELEINIRLECLKLAVNNAPTICGEGGLDKVIELSEALHHYVMKGL